MNRTSRKSVARESENIVTFRFSSPENPPGAAVDGSEIRFLAGYEGPKIIDSMGRTWLSDQYFAGGTARIRQARPIYRTRSPKLYQTAREGDFRYNIPIGAGPHELHLHFAEVLSEEADLDSGGERTRSFDVFLNDERVLRNFDIVADAGGPNIADERVFTDVYAASDGLLHLRFATVFNKASLSGIEVMRGMSGKMRPIRLRAAVDALYDSKGRLWTPDRYFLGGRITRRSVTVSETLDPAVFGSERWGPFTYAIPVANGRYRLTLKFAETYPNASRAGLRVFDVYCNGVALLRNLDVLAAAGGPNRAVDKIYHGLTPTAQGKLVLSFVPVLNYAIVTAIEVEDESFASRPDSIGGL